VQIFNGEEEVVRSAELDGSQWRPERALRRGMTYTWQVRVKRDGDTVILPAAPAPVAQFHILEAASLSVVESAEREHPDNHLLLALLCARAGLEADARAYLARVSDPRDKDVAERLRAQLDSWRSPR
jgi:hypothetical protein